MLARQPRLDRREGLLDAAAGLLAAGEIDAVTMEAVAEQAGVSRPLVYKHFANRAELLEALYTRESAALHAELSAAVSETETLEEMFRALVHGSLSAQASRGTTFAALRAVGRTPARRGEQRGRDRNTLQYFARQAVRQFGLPEAQARAAVSIMLGAIESVLNAFRARPTAEHALLLENTFVTLVSGGLTALARGKK